MTANARRNPELELVKQKVQQKFAEMRAALHMREKLLMRQVEVIEQQQMNYRSRRSSRAPPPRGEAMSPTTPGGAASTEIGSSADVTFLPDYESEVLAAIRRFGRFELDNVTLALQDVLYLPNEDYITPSNDHETMYKCLASTAAERSAALDRNWEKDGADSDQPEAIVVDFSQNKSLLEHNRKHMKDSIINITLLEAKELIRRAKSKRELPIPPLNLEELDDELESSIADAVSSLGASGGRPDAASTLNTLTSASLEEPPERNPNQGATPSDGGQQATAGKKTKKSRFKPKITINNCNGTINLRNIASLTINCATEETLSADIPRPHDPAGDSADADEPPSGHVHVADQVTTPPHQLSQTDATSSSDGGCTSTPTSTTTSSSQDSSSASSRSQSKKLKANKKDVYGPIQGARRSTTTTTTTTETTPPARASTERQGTTTNEASVVTSSYPYELIDETDAAVTCDFYNRLLSEIKHSIKEKSSLCESHWLRSHRPLAQAAMDGAESELGGKQYTLDESTDAPGSAVGCSKRLILKNYENLKIVLEANSDEETPPHPVQIEQWLAEIISETDLEPMQNTDILEQSRLHSGQQGNSP